MRVDLEIENGSLVVRLIEEEPEGDRLLSSSSITLAYLLEEIEKL